jgi:hypothetical protein
VTQTGLGAGVRDDVVNEEWVAAGKRCTLDQPFRASGAVWDPTGQMVPKRKNQDFFANAKAPAWWALRVRFQATYRAVVERMPYVPDDLLAIDPRLEELLPLTLELSQPTYSINSVGKILIDKAPDGMRSPNAADAVMIAFQPSSRSMEVWLKLGSWSVLSHQFGDRCRRSPISHQPSTTAASKAGLVAHDKYNNRDQRDDKERPERSKDGGEHGLLIRAR